MTVRREIEQMFAQALKLALAVQSFIGLGIAIFSYDVENIHYNPVTSSAEPKNSGVRMLKDELNSQATDLEQLPTNFLLSHQF